MTIINLVNQDQSVYLVTTIASVLPTGLTLGVLLLTTVNETILKRERAATTVGDAGLEASPSQNTQSIHPVIGRADLDRTQNRQLKRAKVKEDLHHPILQDLKGLIRKRK